MEWSVPSRTYTILLLFLLVRRDLDQGPYTCWCLSTFYNSRLLWNHECFMQFQLHYFYGLIFATLWVNSANDKSVIYFLLSSCKLFLERICMKCQTLFSPNKFYSVVSSESLSPFHTIELWFQEANVNFWQHHISEAQLLKSNTIFTLSMWTP